MIALADDLDTTSIILEEVGLSLDVRIARTIFVSSLADVSDMF